MFTADSFQKRYCPTDNVTRHTQRQTYLDIPLINNYAAGVGNNFELENESNSSVKSIPAWMLQFSHTDKYQSIIMKLQENHSPYRHCVMKKWGRLTTATSGLLLLLSAMSKRPQICQRSRQINTKTTKNRFEKFYCDTAHQQCYCGLVFQEVLSCP